MENPWKDIPLDDYENHMSLDSVMQLQAMDEMMEGQFGSYPVASLMILGIAGGNGLEHVRNCNFEKVYGIDVNPAYLEAVKQRYADLGETLECLCLDLTEEPEKLPKAYLLIANLLVEYIGYACFQRAVAQVDPAHVSCIIQINTEDGWVSDSPYLHVFDGLEQVHHQMDERELTEAMAQIGYRAISTLEHPLPNGKKLVQLDFERVA